MDYVRVALQSLTAASLVAAAVQAYLILNKLWIRKHDQAVAESISIMGETLGLVPLTILSLNYAMDGYWEGIVDSGIWIVAGVVTIAIGTGRWVEGKRQRGLWALVREALRLESHEVGDLALSLFRPSQARLILEILGQVALLDHELDDRERAFVESFAESWGVELDWSRVDVEESHVNMARLRRSVERYLATSPPQNQVTQLADTLGALVQVDDVTTHEEELMLEELRGMLHDFAGEHGSAARWVVAVVPQDPDQDAALAGLLPDLGKRPLEGGSAYPVGPFFSSRYANVVADQYRTMQFFATVVRDTTEVPATSPSQIEATS